MLPNVAQQIEGIIIITIKIVQSRNFVGDTNNKNAFIVDFRQQARSIVTTYSSYRRCYTVLYRWLLHALYMIGFIMSLRVLRFCSPFGVVVAATSIFKGSLNP